FSPFFFIAPPTTELYTLSLHDALPILGGGADVAHALALRLVVPGGDGQSDQPLQDVPTVHAGEVRLEAAVRECGPRARARRQLRSEEHTSELQSLAYLVCRLLLEKKKK